MNNKIEEKIQRNYYANTANNYNEMHINEKDEHFYALSILISTLDYFEIKSILDIGSGTGRAIKYIQEKRPDIRIVGIEPVKELREIAYKEGLSRDILIDGNALNIAYENNEFDLVCEFGVLHHIKQPEIVVSEMLRVAKKAIFISDSNNFGQGGLISRTLKQLINLIGLWKLIDFVKTKGKGYSISEGDGLFYSYSVFNNFKQIKKHCQSIHLFNTTTTKSPNLYQSASHVTILALKHTSAKQNN
jgi:ubiquinone/menaquinone biosynthesis C-methylase UbiE